MSKVSVIIPIFNAEKTLKKCIKSILKQSFDEFEVILINDGSTDKSLDICRFFQKMDNRITIIDKPNEGTIESRRRGIEKSQSEYITFVDADDWISKDTLSTMYYETVCDDIDITVCNKFITLGSGNLIKRLHKAEYFLKPKLYNEYEIKDKLVTAFFHGHPFPGSLHGKLYRKKVLIGNDKYLDRINFLGDDMFYNMEVLLNCQKVKIIPQPFYYYRKGGYSDKYMPYFFDDILSGYQIQLKVIEEHYKNNIFEHEKGSGIMLLHMYRSALHNLFYSNHSDEVIISIIDKYAKSLIITNVLNSTEIVKQFDSKYIEALLSSDITYLFNLGKSLYRKHFFRRKFITLLASIC